MMWVRVVEVLLVKVPIVVVDVPIHGIGGGGTAAGDGRSC